MIAPDELLSDQKKGLRDESCALLVENGWWWKKGWTGRLR
jgi:hypothetical protein